MAAIVNEEDAAGGVIDEYFAFIYEEPTGENVSTSSEPEEELEKLCDLLEVDGDVEGGRTQTVGGGDLLLQETVEKSVSSDGIPSSLSNALINSTSDSNRHIKVLQRTACDRGNGSEEPNRVSEVDLSKRRGAGDVYSSNGAQSYVGSAFKKFKYELLSESHDMECGVRNDKGNVYGATELLEKSDKGASPKDISINISVAPSITRIPASSEISDEDMTSMYINNDTIGNIGIHSDGNSGKGSGDTGNSDNRSSGTSSSILHLSLPKIPTKPEVFKKLNKASGSLQEECPKYSSSDQCISVSDKCNTNSFKTCDINFSDVCSMNNNPHSSPGNSTDQCSDSQPTNVTSQSIYVHGDETNYSISSHNNNNNMNMQSSTVYIGGSDDIHSRFQVPGNEGQDIGASIPVSIKVSMNSMISPSHQPFSYEKTRNGLEKIHDSVQHQTSQIDPLLEQFLFDEFQHPKHSSNQGVVLGNARATPVYQVNTANNNNMADVLGLNNSFVNGKSGISAKSGLVCDYVKGNTTDKVLDIGSIECNILDELFEGMKVKNEMKEKLKMSVSGKIDNDSASATSKSDDDKHRCRNTQKGNFFDLVSDSKWLDNSLVSNENHSENALVTNEECLESLVESWQYMPGNEDDFNEVKEQNDKEMNLEGAEIANKVEEKTQICSNLEENNKMKDKTEKNNNTHHIDRIFSNSDAARQLMQTLKSVKPQGNTCGPGEPMKSFNGINLAPISSIDSSKVYNLDNVVTEHHGSPGSDFSCPDLISRSYSPVSNAEFKSLNEIENTIHLSSASFSSTSTLPLTPPPTSLSPSSLSPVPSSPLQCHSHPSSSKMPSPLSPSLSPSQNEANSSSALPSVPLNNHFVDPLSLPSSSVAISSPSFQDPPSTPSTLPNSLSSLPPNLSPTLSHVNFFSSHSPLSFTDPSYELPEIFTPEILTPTPHTSDYFPDTEHDRSDYYSFQEIGGAVGGINRGGRTDERGNTEKETAGIELRSPRCREEYGEANRETERSLETQGKPYERRLAPGASGEAYRTQHTSLDISTIYDPADGNYSDEDTTADADTAGGSGGIAATVSRVIRRSMRRMRRLRLSGRRSPNRKTEHQTDEGTEGNRSSYMSEETEVRRDLPCEPSMGLATVRSPAAATIIVTSLVAALAPPPLQAPRELLDPPPGSDLTADSRLDHMRDLIITPVQSKYPQEKKSVSGLYQRVELNDFEHQ
ncbi:hypothetical protein SK128_005237 [Halocaridina rubra]|uniref:Uncharacterized protein n=1 Tax=Halocaridina rubra TaxID=373956 RepID=A0AAN8WFR5_HALRR